LQSKINKIHDIFIKDIAENRNIPEPRARELSTGEFYLGIEAVNFGLIDAVGDIETAEFWLKQKLNLTDVEFAEYKKKVTFFDLLTGVLSHQSFFIGKGIGSELKNTNTVRKLEILT
jgi:ClpP class serine protease